MYMSTCVSCTEDFNKTNHLKVTCPFCDFDACKSCLQTYILSTSKDPHCMNCRHEFNREFVDSFCTKTFRNKTYKVRRENILFEREQARLPETQPYVERTIQIRSLRKSYSWLMCVLEAVKSCGTDNIIIRCRHHLIELLRELIHDVIQEAHALSRTDPAVSRAMPVYTQACLSENCRGFLADNYVCGICKKEFCEKCHEEKHEGHVCDPNTVKSIKLLKKDTKPCPKCNTMIYKIDGCSQMWCTMCHTTFDFNTGMIETGRIHNPHYVEYFKRKTREHGDIPCGGRPNYHELKRNKAPEYILKASLLLSHIDREMFYRFNFTYTDNKYMRVRYLLNEMSKEDFKRELQRRDKYNDKVRDIQEIYRMVLDTVGDALRQYMVDASRADEIINDIKGIVVYYNTVALKIRKRYVARIPHDIKIND